jgi:hypothetical protein
MWKILLVSYTIYKVMRIKNDLNIHRLKLAIWQFAENCCILSFVDELFVKHI